MWILKLNNDSSKNLAKFQRLIDELIANLTYRDYKEIPLKYILLMGY